jgi:hypothetical protein
MHAWHEQLASSLITAALVTRSHVSTRIMRAVHHPSVFVATRMKRMHVREEKRKKIKERKQKANG